MDNVFLTGATGTIGSTILEVLASTEEFSVDCLIRRPESGVRVQAAGGNVVIGDMTDADCLDDISARKDYGYIVHAAQAHYVEHSAAEIRAKDLQAVTNLELLRSSETKLMVYTSGVWMFGHQNQGVRISETTPHRPFASAVDRSNLVRRMLGQTSSPWAHLCPPSLVYGTVGPLAAIARSMQASPIEIIDDESVQWSVIERFDLARAYLALLKNAKPGEFYVVSEDEPIPVVAFYESIARCLAGGPTVRKPRSHFEATLGRERMETKFASQPVDPSLFKRRTGWQARETYSESVSLFLSKSAR
jgi:nucleoside-diphosphate-sugar epimerase